jgi:hypothetical protein
VRGVIDRLARPTVIGRLLAAGWLAVAALLVRIATDGSFTELDLQGEPRWRVVSIAVCLAVALAGLLLAGLLLVRPGRLALAGSGLAGAALLPLAAVLLLIHHDSAVMVGFLGVLILDLSCVGWLRATPRASDT